MSESRFQERFTLDVNGFSGQLFRSAEVSHQSVIVLSGGENIYSSASQIARRFADCRINAMSLSLYGTDNIYKYPSAVPVEPVISAASWMREKMDTDTLGIYATGTGCTFAMQAALMTGDVDTLIMVSPSHIMYEGWTKKPGNSSGSCILTCNGEEELYAPIDRSKGNWKGFCQAYHNRQTVRSCTIPIEKLRTGVLMIAGEADEYWPSAYSVRYMIRRMEEYGFPLPYESLIFPYAGHNLGVLPTDWRTSVAKAGNIFKIPALLHGKERRKAQTESEAAVFEWIRR